LKKVLITLAIVMVASTAAILVIVSGASRDIPEPDVSDLAVDRPDIAPENNAYTYFVSATNTFHWPISSTDISDYLEGNVTTTATLADIFAKNIDTFDLINRGLECEKCITPEVTGFDTLLPYVGFWRNMVRVLAAKSKHDRLAERYTDATDACISLLRFADLIQRDAEGIIIYLVGISILDFGLAQARDLVQDKGTPEDELGRISSTLADLGPFAPGLIRAIKVEYKVVGNTIEDFAAGKFSIDDLTSLGGTGSPSILKRKGIPRYFFKPNTTKQTFAEYFRHMTTNAPLSFAEMNLYDVEGVLGLNNNTIEFLIQPNGVGKILYALLLPALDRVLDRKCRAECSVAATQLLAAVLAYERKNGILPATLDDLVPVYLSAIPEDPYDGKPFRYDSSNAIIYSVGEDLVDADGSSKLLSGDATDSPERQRWNSEDIVFPIRNEIQHVTVPIPSEDASSE
jgi:hypothetical protein